MQLITEDQAIWIQRYGEKTISTFLVRWTLFHQDPGKLEERWRGPFIIDRFGGDHGASYTFKTWDGKSAPNTHHGDHLWIFHTRERYLRSTNKEPLNVTQNLRFRRGKDWSARDLVYLLVTVTPHLICLPCCRHYYRAYHTFIWLRWGQRTYQRGSCRGGKKETSTDNTKLIWLPYLLLLNISLVK